MSVRSDGGAAAFDEDDVAPAVVVAADAVADADGTEPGLGVQPEAGGVLGEDAGLNGPDTGGLGRADQRPEQRGGDAPALVVGVDVDGVLDNARVDAPVGDGRGGDPS